VTEANRLQRENVASRFKAYPAYKDSGVPWLGEIPAHWEVRKTKFAAALRSGHTPSRQHPEYWEDCTIPWFGLADVWQIRDGQKEYVTDTAEKISALGLANSSARLLPKGTVILSRTASVGFSAILGVDMATTQDFVNWVCGPTLRPEYLLYVFRSMQPEFRGLTMGSTHQTIYMPDVARFDAFATARRARSHRRVRARARASDRYAAGEAGAADRAAPGAAHRPHHPRRHQGPGPERPP
jgi:type I restriction modification DNA specificity protein